jgi:hypothetical protein
MAALPYGLISLHQQRQIKRSMQLVFSHLCNGQNVRTGYCYPGEVRDYYREKEKPRGPIQTVIELTLPSYC